jgi:hypothetical protein
MINYIFESVIAGVQDALGATVEFKRIEEKCQQFAPAFLIVANGEPTKILFNTAILNDDKIPLADLVPKIIVGLAHQIGVQLQERI